MLFNSSVGMIPAKALPAAEVSAKLDTVLLLMAVNDNGQPQSVKAKIDGRNVNAYLGAISIAAAEEITAGKLYDLEATTAKSLRFAPVSLSRFNLLLAPLLKDKPKDIGVIVPDPTQMVVAKSLLVAQNIPETIAEKASALQLMIFCPDPGILVSRNDGPDKGKQFVPCSTDATYVESIVKRAIKESTELTTTKPKVIAIPLNNFIAFLNKESEAKAGQLKIVPSSSMIKLIQKISQQQQPASKPESK